MALLTVRSIMTTALITVQSDHSFNFAEGVMRAEGIHHLPVVDEQHRLVGLVTHRDIAQAQASFLARPSGDDLADALSTPVSRIMQTHVHTVGPDARVVDAARVLRAHTFGCLPVIAGDRLVGIVTESDFLELLIELLEAPEQPDLTARPGDS